MSIHQPLDPPGAIRNGLEIDDRGGFTTQNPYDLLDGGRTETGRDVPTIESYWEAVGFLQNGPGLGRPAMTLAGAIQQRDRFIEWARRAVEVEEALREVHEYHCGCAFPGQLDRCVAQPVVVFAVLATRGKAGEVVHVLETEQP